MAANVLRLRRSLALTSSVLSHSRYFTSAVQSVSPTNSVKQNPSLFDITQSKPNSSVSFKFISSRSISSRARYNNDDMDADQISPDAILFEGCDYNHWLITMDFPKDPKPSPEEMVETYVQTAAKVLGSVEEAKKKIYACSTTTYNGFQVEVSEEVSEQFKAIPGVVFVLPDSYIDPVNKEYGGDKYINGTIIPRPPPVQYGRQGGRYNDRNRDYNRPPRGQIEQGNASGGQGNYQGDRRGPMPSYQGSYNQGEGRSTIPARQTNFPQSDQGNASGGQGNYQGDRRGPMPSYQGSYNQGEGRSTNPAKQTDFPQSDQGNFANSDQRGFRGEGSNFTRPSVGGYSQGGGGGGSDRQGGGGQYGQTGGGGYGQATGGQYGQTGGGNYGQGTVGQYGQGGVGTYGQGTGGQYGQGGGGTNGQGTGGQYGRGGGGNYGQGTNGQYGQEGVGRYGQGSGGSYGQQAGGQYGQGMGPGSNQNPSHYGEKSNLLHVEQQEAEAFKGAMVDDQKMGRI